MTERFEQLRLCFLRNDGKPIVTVKPFQPMQYQTMTFSSREELKQAAERFVNEPMDVFGDLLRCVIFEMCGQTGVLLCAHHILIDGFSTQVMVSFLEHDLEGMDCQVESGQDYAEHLMEMNSYAGSRRQIRDRAYWENFLRGDWKYEILCDGAAALDYAASEYHTTIPIDAFSNIKRFCEDQSVSVSSFFFTALGLWLQRETGVSNFTIGMPVMNRTTRRELNSIGLYMRILPLGMRMKECAASDALRDTENGKMDLFRHQQMTQPQLLSLMQEVSGTSAPLYDVVFDYQHFPESEFSEIHLIAGSALSVPLEIHLYHLGQREVQVHIRYRKHLFTQEEICRMWETVMSAGKYMTENPQGTLSQIPRYFLTPQQRRELLEDMNDTAFDYGVEEHATVIHLFEETARKYTQRVCVRTDAEAVNYGQFLRWVQNLDVQIRSVTKYQKSIVAVIADRSFEMFAAIYAAVRGGNAYLPISPEDPPERIRYLLQDSGVSAVLAQTQYVPLAGDIPCIDLTVFLGNTAQSQEIPPAAAEPEDTAYVIYTSGSTGKAKGACISHRALRNRILWMQEAYPLETDSMILHKTPYTFDVSLWEIFWWGIAGASVALSRPGEHFLPAKIMDAVNRHRISHIHFVPSVLELFLSYLEKNSALIDRGCSLKHVFASGEALSADLVRRFYRLFPYEKVRLHNLYGPTECAVDVSFYDCVPEQEDPVPIGKPIYNTQLYVLDSELNPVPKDVEGQLCIGGDNVGQGYLNRPELTAERFVENPYGAGKLYLTGDYAKVTQDGQLLFCGRMDQQIKLNGQRIELGEIEAVIRGLDGIEHAAVMVYPHEERKLLVAVYCGTAELQDEIRSACSRRLPPYMVPSFIIPVPAMPISRNGKLDVATLKQLIAPKMASRVSEPPLSEEEKRICQLFADVLGQERVGRNENFFDLGGGSLAMIQVLSEKEMQGISASAFVANPTPALLAGLLGRKSDKRWLHCLNAGSDCGNALVLIPYAGGGAEAYAQFAAAAEKRWKNCGLYFMDYPRSKEDCEQAARELELLSEHKTLHLYSHCAGAAPALQILEILQCRRTDIIRKYIAGASIPPETSDGSNLWRTVPDAVLREILTKAGASFGTLPETKIASMLEEFRRDTDFWNIFFAQKVTKIESGVTLILSKQDLFTENHTEAVHLWSRYVSNVAAVYYLDTPSHYFQSEQAETLLLLLKEMIEEN